MEDNREKFESGSPSVGYRYLKGANSYLHFQHFQHYDVTCVLHIVYILIVKISMCNNISVFIFSYIVQCLNVFTMKLSQSTVVSL